MKAHMLKHEAWHSKFEQLEDGFKTTNAAECTYAGTQSNRSNLVLNVILYEWNVKSADIMLVVTMLSMLKKNV